MNAWLLTWKWYQSEPKETVAAILSARKGDQSVSELMELLVLRSISGCASAAYYANRRRELVYKAMTPLAINSVPHGERILCGHDPWLYGRKVKSLKIELDRTTNEEIISWVEPDDFRFKDTQNLRVEVAALGKPVTMRRPNKPLSLDVSPLNL
jgi:hypothetical protein